MSYTFYSRQVLVYYKKTKGSSNKINVIDLWNRYTGIPSYEVTMHPDSDLWNIN